MEQGWIHRCLGSWLNGSWDGSWGQIEYIQVEYECPKCGKTWTETHPLSESDYKQMIADYVSKAKELDKMAHRYAYLEI